jgi:catechol 2,3-dioxygenase-like lactoylglutathione lyase family enzyme
MRSGYGGFCRLEVRDKLAPERGERAVQLDCLDHFNIRTTPADTERLRDFYRDVLGLQEGKRPSFPFPGHWLYLGDTPVLHIAGRLPPDAPRNGADAAGVGFDHISFRAHGAKEIQGALDAKGIEWKGTPVPGTEMYQMAFLDPVGVKVELIFYEGER